MVLQAGASGGLGSSRVIHADPPSPSQQNLFLVCLFSEAYLVSAFLLARGSSVAFPAFFPCVVVGRTHALGERTRWVKARFGRTHANTITPFLFFTPSSLTAPFFPAGPAVFLSYLGPVGAWWGAWVLPLLQPRSTSILSWLYLFCSFWFALKQVISCLQMATAASGIIALDNAEYEKRMAVVQRVAAAALPRAASPAPPKAASPAPRAASPPPAAPKARGASRGAAVKPRRR